MSIHHNQISIISRVILQLMPKCKKKQQQHKTSLCCAIIYYF